MHYKLRAMEKMLTSVCSKSTLSHRPVFNKFRQIVMCKDTPEKNLSAIHMEIKNIEDIQAKIKGQSQKTSSEKIKKIMKQVEQKITEGLTLYVSAWRMLATYNEIEKDKTAVTESSEKTDVLQEKTLVTENSEKTDQHKEDKPTETDKMGDLMEYLADGIGNIEDFPEQMDDDPYTCVNDRHVDELLNMAEEAELILMKAEKLMVNSLDDHPLES